jgi:phospholipase/carboxylesterase
MSDLVFRERPARMAEPDGLLLLHHGRGTDEHDLLTLGDVLDPDGRLHVVTPRAPLVLPGSPGYHWYRVPRVGYPDPESFAAAFRALAELHDELWERTELEPARTILGGFSMGAVMSYALGLGSGRPVPAGIIAFSGFIPAVEGWDADLDGRRGLPTFVAHGRRDAVIGVELARAAVERLQAGGLQVSYHESDAGHHIDPRELTQAATWVQETLDGTPGAH